jgi:hydrophobe/amphiphile efflux-1 (HAE1) family protein
MEAAMKGMAEVTSPVIATSLVLFAVFVPVAFMPGISGQLYKQFALTIAFSVGISTVCALTIAPAMCAIFLKPKSGKEPWFFKKFNDGFSWSSHVYQGFVDKFIKRWRLVLLLFTGMLVLTYVAFKMVPTAFVPDEDQGYFYVIAEGPEGMSLERTHESAKMIENITMATKGVEDVVTIGGYNMITGAIDSSSITMIVILTEWKERKNPELGIDAIMNEINMRLFSGINQVSAFAFNPPPIQGLSQTGGFQFEIQDRMSHPLDELNQVAQNFIEAGKTHKALAPLSTMFKLNYPQYYIDLDRTKAKTMDIAISDIFTTLQAYLGSLYVNDFNKFGRIYRVFIQAKADSRSDMTDISKLYVRAGNGELVPISALVKIEKITGPQTVTHYNIYRNIELNGGPAAGYSSGDAIKAMEKLASTTLPDGYGFEWTGTAYQEIKSAGMAPFIFALALAFVFLFLAAQYESWSLPIVIMMAVPLAILGALVAQWLRGLYNDVYCQIGLVMLIGLASKNSILLVEFAKDKHEEGLSIIESAILAAKIRLRPILMTALSFILGVVPLVVATGAGAASRHSLGTAVFGGMIASTFLSLIVVPVIYVIMMTLKERGFQRSDCTVLAAWLKTKTAAAHEFTGSAVRFFKNGRRRNNAG